MNPGILDLVFAIVGALAGVGGYAGVSRRAQSQSGQKAEAIVREAEKKAEKIASLAAGEADKRRQAIMKEAEERQEFLKGLERSTQQREATIDKRLAEVEKSRQEWERKNEEVLQVKEAVREIREKQEASLERIAHMTRTTPRRSCLTWWRSSRRTISCVR
jgi:ribonuclease Y